MFGRGINKDTNKKVFKNTRIVKNERTNGKKIQRPS